MIIQQYDLFNFIDNGKTDEISITIIKARKKYKPRKSPTKRREEVAGQIEFIYEVNKKNDRRDNI